MTVKELARAMGYTAQALAALAKSKGLEVGEPGATVEPRLAQKVRAQVPHRAKLSGPLLEVFSRLPGKPASAPPPKPPPERPSKPPPAPPSRPLPGGLAEALRARPSKVAVDTSSLMMDRAIRVYRGQVRPALKAAHGRLIVPAKVVEELLRHASRTDEGLAESAIQGLGILAFLGGERLTEEVKSAADLHADEDMLALVNRFRGRFSVHVLTQDVALMVDIHSMAQAESVREIKPIAVWEIRNGQLRSVSEEEARQRRRRQKGLRPS
jgi:hypothetical protein